MSLLSTLSAQPLGNRIVQCLGLAVAFGLGLWTLLLHLFYRKTLTQALLSAWVTPQSDQLLWQCVLGLCLFCGLLASGWLYRELNNWGRLHAGDRHHRGARVVVLDRED